MSGPTLQDLAGALERLHGEMRAVRAELDAVQADLADVKAEQAAAAREREAELDADTLVMLAAAVTSYLGKRVRIRSARRVVAEADGAPAWARHGRAAIQTSHQLPRGH